MHFCSLAFYVTNDIYHYAISGLRYHYAIRGLRYYYAIRGLRNHYAIRGCEIIMPLEACEIIMPLVAGDGFKLNLFVVIVNVPFYLFYYIIDILNYLLVGETHNMKANLF